MSKIEAKIKIFEGLNPTHRSTAHNENPLNAVCYVTGKHSSRVPLSPPNQFLYQFVIKNQDGGGFDL